MLADRAARGLHAHWRTQCGYVAGGEVAEHDGVLLTVTNLSDETLSCAFVPGTPADPAGAVDWFVAEFERRGLRPGMELREGLHPEIEDLLRRRGFRVVVRRPAMTCAPLTGRQAEEAAGVEVREVQSGDDLAAFRQIQSEVFELAPDVARGFLPRAALDVPGVRWFLATYDGVPCGTAAASLSEHGAGVVGVGTLEAYRHRGVGRTVTSAAVAWAAARGADLAWLYPSDMARRMYERLGFDTLDDVAQVWVA